MQYFDYGFKKMDSFDCCGLLKNCNLYSSINYFNKALDIFQKDNNFLYIYNTYYYIAVCNEKLGNISESITYFLESAKTIETLNYEKAIDIYLYLFEKTGNWVYAEKIASIYYKYDSFDLSNKYYQLAFDKCFNVFDKFNFLTKRADIMCLQKDYKSALAIYNKLLKEKSDTLFGKWTCNELIYKCVICSLFISKDPSIELKYYDSNYPEWKNCQQHTLCEDLILALSTNNKKLFSKAIKSYTNLLDWDVLVLYELYDFPK
jgi:tetratricopeptide (TPR) repeat protein